MHDDISRPATGWFLVLDGGILALAILGTSAPAYRAVRARLPLPPRRALVALLAGTAVVHLAEALVAFRTARGRGSAVPGRWALQTLVVGFPSLRQLHQLEPRDSPS